MTTNTDNTKIDSITPFKCPKCPKAFMSQAGVNMHNARVHTKTMLARGQKGWKPNPNKRHYPNASEQKKKKYREARDRFYAMGLDAKGNPFKTEFGSKVSQRMRRNQSKLEWSPERKAKFSRTMKRIAARKRLQQEAVQVQKERPSKRIQFVYSFPDQQQQPPPTETAASAIKFCPHCGRNIEKHL